MVDSKITTMTVQRCSDNCDIEKGDRSECDNYRGISLTLNAGEVLAKILLKILHAVVEVIISEIESGFRAPRSTISMTLTLQLQHENAVELVCGFC